MANVLVGLTKACSRCGIELRRNLFPKASGKPRPWCSDCESKRRAKQRKRSPLAKFGVALRRAILAGKACNLTAAELVALWEQQDRRCALSGVLMTWGSGLEPTTISIDRLNPKRGYVKGNVRLICFALNSLRGAGTDAQALEIATAFVEYQKQRAQACLF